MTVLRKYISCAENASTLTGMTAALYTDNHHVIFLYTDIVVMMLVLPACWEWGVKENKEKIFNLARDLSSQLVRDKNICRIRSPQIFILKLTLRLLPFTVLETFIIYASECTCLHSILKVCPSFPFATPPIPPPPCHTDFRCHLLVTSLI